MSTSKFAQEEACEIIHILKQNSYEAYLIGGCVRDMILGRTPKDYDVVTNATPEQISEVFKERKLAFVGEKFRVMIVGNTEVATYRGWKFSGVIGKPTCTYVDTLVEDCARRDFTINSIAYDIDKDKFIDHYGGISDIKNKNIKFVGDARERIQEDDIRILRAFRFASVLGFKIDQRSYNIISFICRKNKLQDSSKERIATEVISGMSGDIRQFVSYMKDVKILQNIFPSLEEVVGLYGGKHHSETVFEHCVDTAMNISSRYPYVRLAGLLHDVGKIKYELTIDGMSFHRHELHGATFARKDLEMLRLSNKETDRICNLIECHMWTIMPNSSDKAVRRYLVALKQNNISLRDAFRLRIADRKANKLKKQHPIAYWKNVLRKIKKIESNTKTFCIGDLEIDGNDVMRILSLKPSDRVGTILRDIFVKVIAGQFLNERDELLDYLKCLNPNNNKKPPQCPA